MLKTKKGSLIILFILMAVIAGWFGFQTVAKWFDNNEIKFNQILKVEVKAPFEIIKREPQIKEIVLDYPAELMDTPIKKYICDKFGLLDCKVALAVASSEGLNHAPDDFNINTNGTIDVGYFRINSIHFKKPGCSLAEVITEKGNIDCAYSIWKQQGNWSAWVSYINGSYLNKL